MRFTANIKPNSTQVILESIHDWFWEKVDGAFENKKLALRIFPLIVSFFLVILISNLFGLLPILNAVTIEGAPMFKVPSGHLSMTLALTLIALFITHATALSIHPIKYIGNYIKIGPVLAIRSTKDIGEAFLGVFLGILDLIGEFAKVISLSFRLFGNIIAGELMGIIIMSISVYTQFILPVPFIFLGILSGVIQAAVFCLLALNYMSLAVSSVQSKKK